MLARYLVSLSLACTLMFAACGQSPFSKCVKEKERIFAACEPRCGASPEYDSCVNECSRAKFGHTVKTCANLAR